MKKKKKVTKKSVVKVDLETISPKTFKKIKRLKAKK